MQGYYPPILKSEMLELFEKEKSICIIKTKKIINNTIIDIRGNGFFIELNEACIPFNKCLITCNHILGEENIKIGEKIKLEYKNKEIKLDFTKRRRAFTDKRLDYTLIEIFDNDKIKYFFPIRINPDYYKYHLNNKDVFIFQYHKGLSESGISYGKILSIKDDRIIYNCPYVGNSGVPI